MRTKKRIVDYGAISRRSIKSDFRRVQIYSEREKRPQIENSPEINAERRVLFVGTRTKGNKVIAVCEFIQPKQPESEPRRPIGYAVSPLGIIKKEK